jgi:hypothetical protein
MKTKAFNWGRSTMVSDRAYWMGFYLEAWEDGRWRVTFADERGHPLVDHTKQAIGTNIIEAKTTGTGRRDDLPITGPDRPNHE